MGEVFITPLPLLELGAKLGVGRLRELTAAYDDLEKMGDDIVKRRRAQRQSRRQRAARLSRCVFWTRCCFWRTRRRANPAYTDEELWGDMNDIMAAGRPDPGGDHDRRCHISRHADVKAKVEAEVA